MNRSAFFIILLFLVVGIEYQLFSQDTAKQKWSRESSEYPGLKFWIDQKSADSYFDDLDNYGKHWNGQPTLPTILKNMDDCFNEAVAMYENNNKKLPSCLTNGLNKLLEKLKKPGRPILNCTWHKDPNQPWPFVYKQKFNFVEESAIGMSTTAERIYLITLWQKTYEYKFREESRTVLTSSILMHELIHCVKKHYPKCFKTLEEPEEEGTTEDGQVKIYTDKKCGTYYKDYEGWDYECTYESICECDCSDK